MVRTYLRKIKSTWSLLVFVNKIKKDSGRKYFYILHDYLSLKKRKGLKIEEYYQYELEKQDREMKESFLGENEQRFYLDLLNPKKYYTIARNKYFSHLFLETAHLPKAQLYCYYNPEYKLDRNERISYDYKSTIRILQEKKVQECVIKTTESSHGDNVWVIRKITFTEEDCILEKFNGQTLFLSKLLNYEPLIFESLIKQTKQFEQFNESSVNTVRFMTTLYPDGNVKIIATFIKIGRQGTCVDNAGNGGNVDAAIDTETGKLQYVIRYDGIRKVKPITHHPDSGNLLDGVQIENWEIVKKKIIGFQQAMPYLKAIGWDIAITGNGPVVIEMNEFWDRTGQMFIRRGWRKEIRACYRAWKELEDKGLVRYPFERQNNPLSVRKLNKIVNLE